MNPKVEKAIIQIGEIVVELGQNAEDMETKEIVSLLMIVCSSIYIGQQKVALQLLQPLENSINLAEQKAQKSNSN